MAADDFDAHPLWEFSLAHYRTPGVAAACLRLQDEHGFDVNVALACLWHEGRGGSPLMAEDFAALLEHEARARVLAIRPIRRGAKAATGADALYRTLKTAELQAENLFQRALYDALVDRGGDEPGTGRASLRAYAEHLGANVSDSLLDAFMSEPTKSGPG
ncbi:MAG: TIGR02444 family protein [Myxococcota bacterium]